MAGTAMSSVHTFPAVHDCCRVLQAVPEEEGRWGGRLLVVYMEAAQGKKDSRNLNAVSMVQ